MGRTGRIRTANHDEYVLDHIMVLVRDFVLLYGKDFQEVVQG